MMIRPPVCAQTRSFPAICVGHPHAPHCVPVQCRCTPGSARLWHPEKGGRGGRGMGEGGVAVSPHGGCETVRGVGGSGTTPSPSLRSTARRGGGCCFAMALSPKSPQSTAYPSGRWYGMAMNSEFTDIKHLDNCPIPNLEPEFEVRRRPRGPHPLRIADPKPVPLPTAPAGGGVAPAADPGLGMAVPVSESRSLLSPGRVRDASGAAPGRDGTSGGHSCRSRSSPRVGWQPCTPPTRGTPPHAREHAPRRCSVQPLLLANHIRTGTCGVR